MAAQQLTSTTDHSQESTVATMTSTSTIRERAVSLVGDARQDVYRTSQDYERAYRERERIRSAITLASWSEYTARRRAAAEAYAALREAVQVAHQHVGLTVESLAYIADAPRDVIRAMVDADADGPAVIAARTEWRRAILG